MRLAKLLQILLMMALPVVPTSGALAQDHPNVQPNAVRDQLMQTAIGSPAQKSSPQNGNPPSSAPASKRPAGATAPAKGASAKAPVEKPGDGKGTVARRDPFNTLINKARQDNAPPENLPPGKAGLVVANIRIDGIVHGTGGMIAIVSNPQQRVYFLREGDKLYDGAVDKITIDAVSFHEFGKDAFGKTLERQVTKRLYPSPGEQQ